MLHCMQVKIKQSECYIFQVTQLIIDKPMGTARQLGPSANTYSCIQCIQLRGDAADIYIYKMDCAADTTTMQSETSLYSLSEMFHQHA